MEEKNIEHVLRHWLMGGEIANFVKVWLTVYASLCYCYLVSKIVGKGVARVVSFFPIVCLFVFLPLNLGSVHLAGTTGFFVAWLANFKLLLLAFGQGPLSDPNVSLPLFVAVACLPIKIRQNRPNQKSKPVSPSGQNSILNYGVKGILLVLFLRVYEYTNVIHPTIILVVYSFHIYFGLELILAVAAALARGLVGVDLEPQFNEPILSTSLQDFWGRRWNLMVTRIMRPTVYDPVVMSTTKMMSRKWAPLPAIMATFVVSGLMHELIFYYLGREKPTWEITFFFLLHGVSLVVEVTAKKAVGHIVRVPRLIGTILTVGYVLITGFWLFFPQLLKSKVDSRAFEEYAAVGGFVMDLGRALNLTFITSSNSTGLQ